MAVGGWKTLVSQRRSEAEATEVVGRVFGDGPGTPDLENPGYSGSFSAAGDDEMEKSERLSSSGAPLEAQP